MHQCRSRQYIPAPVTFAALALLFLFFSGCGSAQTPDLSSTRTVDISSGSEELATLETFFQGEKLVEPLIIKVPAGYSLPVRFDFSTPIAKLSGDCGDLVFSRDIYLYMSEQMMLVSPDLKSWAAFADLEGIKELFGAGPGEIKIGMSAEKGSGPLLQIGVTVHPKEQ